MAKNKVFLHIGPGITGVDEPHEALRHDEALLGAGVTVPDVGQDDLHRADLEIRRRHKTEGLKRKDVEGAWAAVCRAAFKAKGDVVITQPGFVDANYQQVALALDGLVGLQLHLVLTPAEEPTEAGLAELVGDWAKFVKLPERIHVVPVGDGVDPGVFAHEIARMALVAEKTDLDRRLAKLKKKRRKVKMRLGRADAA
jgi:hypothetical protein